MSPTGSPLQAIGCSNVPPTPSSKGAIFETVLSATDAGGSLVASVLELPAYVEISATDSSPTLGGANWGASDAGGTVLPIFPQWSAGAMKWRIPRAAIAGTTIDVWRRDRSGAVRTQAISVDAAGIVQLDAYHPPDASALAYGAHVPLQLVPADTARLQTASFTWAGGDSTELALFSQSAAGWVDVPATGTDAPLLWAVDGATAAAHTISLRDNQPPGATVLLLKPANNAEYLEGEQAEIEARVTSPVGVALRYAEVLIRDVNGLLIDRVPVATDRGLLRWTMPEVAEPETVRINVRAYHGDAFDYDDSATATVRVFPALRVDDPELLGLGRQMMAGSELQLEISNASGGLQGQIVVTDQTGSVIAQGGAALAATVPPSGVSELRVTASLEDEVGNRSEIERSARVVPALTVRLGPETESFDTSLAGVGETYFARGAELHRRDAFLQTVTRVATLGSEILDLAYLGSNVLATLADGAVVTLDAEDGYTEISSQPMGMLVDSIAVGEGDVLTASSGGLSLHPLQGTEIGTGLPLEVPGTVVEIRSVGPVYWAWTSEGLFEVDAGAVRTIVEAPLQAYAVHRGHLFWVDSNGRLQHTAPSGVTAPSSAAVDADALIALQGVLIGLAPDGVVSIIDVQDPAGAELVGSFPLPFAEDVRGALLSGGKLWLGGASGRVIEIERPTGPPESASRAAGRTRSDARSLAGIRLLRRRGVRLRRAPGRAGQRRELVRRRVPSALHRGRAVDSGGRRRALRPSERPAAGDRPLRRRTAGHCVRRPSMRRHRCQFLCDRLCFGRKSISRRRGGGARSQATPTCSNPDMRSASFRWSPGPTCSIWRSSDARPSSPPRPVESMKWATTPFQSTRTPRFTSGRSSPGSARFARSPPRAT